MIIVGIEDLDQYLNELKAQLRTKEIPMVHHFELYDGGDIKSAVEWLKFYIKNRKRGVDSIKIDALLKVIDETFPDLYWAEKNMEDKNGKRN